MRTTVLGAVTIICFARVFREGKWAKKKGANRVYPGMAALSRITFRAFRATNKISQVWAPQPVQEQEISLLVVCFLSTDRWFVRGCQEHAQLTVWAGVCFARPYNFCLCGLRFLCDGFAYVRYYGVGSVV